MQFHEMYSDLFTYHRRGDTEEGVIFPRKYFWGVGDFLVKAKAFKEISFITETTSIYSLNGRIQHDRRSQTMAYFRLQFYLGFVLRCTIQS